MELDEIKNIWSQYDEKLNKNLKFNETLLQKMNLNKSRLEMQKPLIYELISAMLVFLFTAYLIAISMRIINEPKFSVPGLIAAVITIIYFAFSVIRLNKFLKLEYYDSSILKLQKQIANLKYTTSRFLKFELILAPFLVLTTLPIMFKVIHNFNVYENVLVASLVTIFVIACSIPLVIWIYKHLYAKKISNTEKLLKEIEAFEFGG